MASHPGNAREAIALRNELQTTLPADVVVAINWRTVVDAAALALARGWTGHELARWALADLSGAPADNPGALVVTTMRNLGQVDPPREATSQPPDVRDVLAGLHRAHAPADAVVWTARIRAQLAERRRA